MTEKNSQNKIRLTPLTPADVGARHGDKFITLDSQSRLMLSAKVRSELGIAGVPARLALSYDVKTRTIGVVKQDVEKVPNAYEIKTDVRGYANRGGRAVADKLALSIADAPYRFAYIGKIADNGVDWFAFRLEAE